MFCRNCGNEIPTGETTCSNCGTKIATETTYSNSLTVSNSSNLFKDFFSFILNCLKKPFSSIEYAKETLPEKTTYIFAGVLFLLIPILVTILSKIFLSSLQSDILSFANLSSGGFYDPSASEEVSTMFSTLFPTLKIFLMSFLAIFIPFGVTTLLMFIIYRYVCKEDYTITDFLNVTIVALSIVLVFSLLSGLLLFISSTVSIFITIVGFILSLVILFTGFKDMSNDTNRFFYIFSISFALVLFLLNYVVTRILISHLIGSFMNFNSFY